MDVRHAQELAFHLFDFEILIRRFCKEIKEATESTVLQSAGPTISSTPSDQHAPASDSGTEYVGADGTDGGTNQVIDLSSDSEAECSEPARGVSAQNGIPDLINDEEAFETGQHESMDTQEETQSTERDGTLDLPQVPIAQPGFANSYYSRVNLYDLQRVGAVPPKLSVSERYQRSIPDRLYKQDEFRSIFDYIELRQVEWKKLLEPDTVKFVFDAEDEFILKERIYYHGKTAEQLQLDLFKFGLPRRAEYIFKYFEKPLTVPLKFKKLERLLGVLMFHSLLQCNDDSDWYRVLKNLFIDGIIVKGDPKSWLWEFHLQVFSKDANYFASSSQQLTEMKLRMKQYLMKNL